MKQIGVIGVGMMGHGIATNIRKHGYALGLLEHPGNQPLDALRAAGATSTADPKELAASVAVLILCVTGTPQVEDVLFNSGVLEALRPGTVVIDCSTAIPESTMRIAAAVQGAGARFLDAPMTRTPKEAAEGRINLIVGGERAVFDECLPLLQSFAENIVYAGEASSGHRLKLLHNFVSLGFSAVLAEAAACASRAGVDPEVLVSVLAAGGGDGVVFKRLRPFIESADSSGFRFSMSNALKDMSYYVSMTGEVGAAHTAASAVREVYQRAVTEGGGNTPVPELIALLAGNVEQAA
ncbi:2-hydroxy-3-oxopropionate reductase [Caballeronia temeraria]|uniref:2-hydroxy-3-oxopropionate reductase n=1 Tax=Caballeronia temeraria TaxID=1777137 RepID=A0A158DX95_9BURK|nr:NAD(P)-dependent oxidoreductase [Caballeronia temeraria]SAK98836.1 2-hydroxy-3-oxopropionate reductase [Caballeronia temeraria]